MEYKYYATCTRNDLDDTEVFEVHAANDIMTLYRHIMHSFRYHMLYAFDFLPYEAPRFIRWEIMTTTGEHLFSFELIQVADLSYSVQMVRHQCASAPGMRVMYFIND